MVAEPDRQQGSLAQPVGVALAFSDEPQNSRSDDFSDQFR
jgi:hypothetical protein